MRGTLARLQTAKARDFHLLTFLRAFGDGLTRVVQRLPIGALGQVVLIRELSDQAFPSNWPTTSAEKVTMNYPLARINPNRQ